MPNGGHFFLHGDKSDGSIFADCGKIGEEGVKREKKGRRVEKGEGNGLKGSSIWSIIGENVKSGLEAPTGEEKAMKQSKGRRDDTERWLLESPEPETWRVGDTLWVVLYSVLLFLSMTVLTGRMSVILCFTALVASLPIGKRMLRRVYSRLNVAVMGLLLFGLLQGLAAIYTPFDESGVREYYKF